ncbi:heme ABC exporter ATP-binding protein CcmA [Zavarzinia sp. CC-PAN008]|uniref:heme ABC exporter ATP-binding protein CcmA n=1 Tax=Zavarzinia sp. CC-PAN008 TaxID=3243332 RepID=UPI003F748C63
MSLEAQSLACIRGERVVFAKLSLSLAAGQAMVLVGPNGAGKSSLLRLLATLLQPAEGRLLWRGVAVDDDPDAYRADIAYVGHLDGIKLSLGVAENLAFWAGAGGVPRADVPAALAHFGLKGLADLPARLLSAGQKRRLGLARLLLAPKRLWLLDEPTVSLDVAGVEALVAAIAAHRAAGGSVIAASHIPLGLDDAEVFALK